MKFFGILAALIVAIDATFLPKASSIIGEDNPRWHMNASELIKSYGYKAETHTVETPDGYILTIFRIPQGINGTRGKRPVLLQHGFINSADDWLITPPGIALPYLLADAGRDVWIGNFRGNNYSMKHRTLSPDDYGFWNFSHHEIGQFDLPAMVDYILNTTDRNVTQIDYVGHSLGCALFMSGVSMNLTLQSKIHKMVALAPAVHLCHIRTILASLFILPTPVVKAILKVSSQGRVYPKYLELFINQYTPAACTSPLSTLPCSANILCFGGPDVRYYGFTPGAVSMINAHSPSTGSWKTLAHLMQYGPDLNKQCDINRLGCPNGTSDGAVESDCTCGAFAQFDYGWEGNLRQYGSCSPPKYNLSAIQTRIALMWGNNDYLVSPKDAIQLMNELPNADKGHSKQVPDCDYNHQDMLYHPTAKTNVYDNCMAFFEDDSDSDPGVSFAQNQQSNYTSVCDTIRLI